MSSRGWIWLVVLLSPWAEAAAQTVLDLEDPAGDASGPGTYLRPTHGDFQDGDFDLRRFEVRIEGKDAIFEVTLGAPIRRPDIEQRTNESAIPLDNGIYLQNVDIYLDTDKTPGGGFDVSIPGRHVAFAPGQTWETAIVLTPQPGPTRNVLESALGAAAAHVYLPQPVRSRGRTLIARVPLSVLGGPPKRSWGYSLQVSGASWERNFSVARRVFGRNEENAFTMDVVGLPEEWVFGGAPQGSSHPRVIDVLLPQGVSQQAALGGFDEKAGTFARVPFVYPEGGAPVAAPSAIVKAPVSAEPGKGSAAASGGAATGTVAAPQGAPAQARPPVAPTSSRLPVIVDITEELVSIDNVPAGVRQLQFARVVDAQGATVGRLMIMRVNGTSAVAQIVAGREKVVRGAQVSFDRGAPAPDPH